MNVRTDGVADVGTTGIAEVGNDGVAVILAVDGSDDADLVERTTALNGSMAAAMRLAGISKPSAV